MIVYGHNHRKISKAPVTVQLKDEQGNSSPLDVDVFLHYGHLFWIPLFPMGKKVGFKQEDSVYSIKLEALTPKEQDEVTRMKAEAGTPWWSFSGLILLGLFVMWGFMVDGQTTENQKSYSQTPVVGDIWVLTYKDDSTSKDQFALARVHKVQGDSVWAYVSEDSYTLEGAGTATRSDFKKLLRKEKVSYTDQSLVYSFGELASKHEAGVVKYILRADE